MAGNSASLSIRVLVDAAQGAGQLRELGNAAGSTGDQFKNMLAAGAAFAGVTAFMKGAVDQASKLQQSTGGVEAVFKSSADAVKGFADKAANSLGLSKSAYQDLATVIGSQLKNAGVSMDQLAPKTDEIIRKGGDLAAMFGGTTADAVGALSSALKGEMDPIERYGISLNANAIKAEEMALGLDTSTTAAEQNAKAVATMSLINKQSADATGAAAREADSYASVMQQLNAVWDNTLAAVGTALLPALSKLGGAMTTLAPAVAGILGPLAEFVGWALQLPTPILAIAAGMALWKFSPIASMLSSVGTALKNATSSAGGFRTAMGSIASTVAGGLGLAAVGFIITQIAGASAEAKRRSDEWAASITDLGNQLVTIGDRSSEAFREVQRNSLEASEGFKALMDAGVSYGDAMSVLQDGNAAGADAIARVGAALTDMDPELGLATARLAGLGDEAQKYADQKTAYVAAEQAKAAATGQTSAAAAQAAEAQQAAAEATAKAALESAKAAASVTEVKTALQGSKDAADAAATAISFFVLQMDAAAGRTPSVDQAAQLLNDTMRDTASAFHGAAEGGAISMDALVNWNAATLTSTANGSALYSQLTKVQTAYATSTVAAYESAGGSQNSAAAMAAASGAADTAYNAFITMATGAGMTTEAAQALATNLGIVQGQQIDPKTFELIAKNEQADKALKDAQAAQIDPKSVVIDATVAPAEGAMTALEGQTLQNTVAVDADPKAAQSTINGVVNEKRTTTPVNVTADPSQANSTVNGFTQTQRTTTVNVQANTTAAQGAITSLVNQQRTLTITVDANTGPARNAIAAITGGNYTATVNVTANTSAAQAAIASVPRSVTVAPPPAPAPAAAFAAPSLRAMAAPTMAPAPYGPIHFGSSNQGPQPVGNVTYEINVQGGWDSSDAIARRVADVLQQRERRMTGVKVRAIR
jgi:hypothetical protein